MQYVNGLNALFSFFELELRVTNIVSATFDSCFDSIAGAKAVIVSGRYD